MEQVFYVEKLTNKRSKNGYVEYRVKWEGWPSLYNSWEPEENIIDKDLISSFEKRRAAARANLKQAKSKNAKIRKTTTEQATQTDCQDGSKMMPDPTNSDEARYDYNIENNKPIDDDSLGGPSKSSKVVKSDAEETNKGKINPISKVNNTQKDKKTIGTKSLKRNVAVLFEEPDQVMDTASVAEIPTQRFQSENMSDEEYIPFMPNIDTFITEVTVKSETVTFLECKTNKGFFKSSD